MQKDAVQRLHVSAALYEKNYDFPEYVGESRQELMIAATPRSGSTAFGLELWRTGVLGAPLEYANFRLMSVQSRWAPDLSDKMAYWSKIKAVRTGLNGVFSYKFFVSNYSGVVKADCRLLSKISPTHVIYLRREDLLAQAISYFKASHSGEWFGGGAAHSSPLKLNVDLIKECYLHIRRQMMSWETVFELTKTDVLRVTYEQLMQDPLEVKRRSAAHVLGTNVSFVPMHIPEIAVQRDSQTADWLSALRVYEAEWSNMKL